MNDLITIPARAVRNILDKESFQQIAAFADIMASSSLIPESLSHEGSGDKKKALAPERVRANCFLVANQAVNWGMDPFAVAQCSSVVHGRLMFEGKLVASVLDANLGIKLVHAFGKWDKNSETCILGQDGSGDDLAIRIGEGRYDEDGSAIFTGRFVDGHVGGWKTTGANTPWRPGRNRTMLVYRGGREFSRIYEPAVMLGVISDDEYDPAYNARDITPASAQGAGSSVIDRLRAEKSTGSSAGFDPARINKDIDSARPPRADGDGGNKSSTEVEDIASQSSTSDNTDRETAGSSQGGRDEGAAGQAGQPAAPALPVEKQQEWLFNVGSMLWAGTNFRKDRVKENTETLENQRKTASASYPADGIEQPVLDRAKSVFKRCMTVVTGDCPADEALDIVAGIIKRDKADVLKRAGKAGA